MIKRIKIIIPIFLVMLLCGCKSDLIIADKPLKKKDVIGYVQNEIYEKTGDETKVKIINKEESSVCTFWFDDCLRYQTIKGAYTYEVEIINKTNKKIIATGKYEDGYIKYDDYMLNL